MNWLFDQAEIFIMVSSQSFLHLRTSIRRTADAPYFANGSANWSFINPLHFYFA